MFKKSKPAPTPQVPAERINAIAARIPPIDYCDSSGRGRRPTRSPSFKQATVRTSGGDEVPVVIKNISSTGLRVEYFQARPLGEHGDRVLIVEPSLPLRAWAQVVWQGDGAGGLQIELSEKE
jgi:hypothetical protein